MSKKFSTYQLTFSAISLATALVLSIVLAFIKLPQGGSVGAMSMFLVFGIGIKYGYKHGFICGVIYGLLQYILAPYFYAPIQFLLDYILGFGVLGLGSLFFYKRGSYVNFCISYVIVCLLRFVMSTISGVVFFAEYAPEGMNPILYSSLYNISYIGFEVIATLIIISIPPIKNLIISTYITSTK